MNGRAAGPDGIPPELLKCATGPVAAALHSLILMVWREGRVPAEWRDGIITALYKGKGSKADCGNYCPITLLSVPGKSSRMCFLRASSPCCWRTAGRNSQASRRGVALPTLSGPYGFSLRFTGNSFARWI